MENDGKTPTPRSVPRSSTLAALTMPFLDLENKPAQSADVFRSSREVLEAFRWRAMDLLTASPLKQLVLSFLGGSFICFGAAVAVTLSEGSVLSSGAYRIYIALGFMTGFVALFLSGATIFTEVNVVLPLLMMKSADRRQVLLKQLQFWGMVWLGNLVGTLFVATLFNCAFVLGRPQIVNLEGILLNKLRYKANGGGGWFQVVLSGALCNWMMGLASFCVAKSRIIVSTIVGVFFPVLVFVTLSLEQTVANMSLFFLYLTYPIAGPLPTTDVISWGDAFGWSIVPSSIGNAIGAVVLVSMLFTFVIEDGLLFGCCCTKKRTNGDDLEMQTRTNSDFAPQDTIVL
jgi:formate/nitrite transporter FocA (FNT family)